MDSQKYICAYQNDGLNHTFAPLRHLWRGVRVVFNCQGRTLRAEVEL